MKFTLINHSDNEKCLFTIYLSAPAEKLETENKQLKEELVSI